MSLIGAGTVILACIWIFVAISILITAYFRGPLMYAFITKFDHNQLLLIIVIVISIENNFHITF